MVKIYQRKEEEEGQVVVGKRLRLKYRDVILKKSKNEEKEIEKALETEEEKDEGENCEKKEEENDEKIRLRKR